MSIESEDGVRDYIPGKPGRGKVCSSKHTTTQVLRRGTSWRGFVLLLKFPPPHLLERERWKPSRWGYILIVMLMKQITSPWTLAPLLGCGRECLPIYLA